MADELLEWSSGVGGVQCEDCERTTICRRVGIADGCDCEGWLCRPCVYGWPDDEEFSPSDSLGAASTTLQPAPR